MSISLLNETHAPANPQILLGKLSGITVQALSPFESSSVDE